MDDDSGSDFGDDLYGDLDPSFVAKSPPHTTAVTTTTTTTTATTATTTTATKAASSLSGNAPLPPVGSLAYDAMADENAVLRKNISTLWLTAKAEIRRKDREIGRLKEELARLAKDTQHDG
mmetsp:Transcript_14570/g.29717  ORF Transcript_14570/g.29717 Transcript_14570/m.29717 type:complete len:121 (-) Transcript_14570:33-395(-)